MTGRLVARSIVLALLCAACITVAPTPGPTASPTPTPSPSPNVAFRCVVSDHPEGCAAARAAVMAAVAGVGFPVKEIYLREQPQCWPWMENTACPAALTSFPPGFLAGYVAFVGTDTVAAVSVEPSASGGLTVKIVGLQAAPWYWHMP